MRKLLVLPMAALLIGAIAAPVSAGANVNNSSQSATTAQGYWGSGGKEDGVEAYGSSSVTLRAYIDTMAGEQWNVGRELRRRLKQAYTDERIASPYPRQVMVTRTGSAEEANER